MIDREKLSGCEGCGAPIYVGDRYHSGDDVDLCEACAPTYAEMLTDHASFVDSDGDPMTKAAARKRYEAHLSAGGKPSDKIVR